MVTKYELALARRFYWLYNKTSNLLAFHYGILHKVGDTQHSHALLSAMMCAKEAWRIGRKIYALNPNAGLLAFAQTDVAHYHNPVSARCRLELQKLKGVNVNYFIQSYANRGE